MNKMCYMNKLEHEIKYLKYYQILNFYSTQVVPFLIFKFKIKIYFKYFKIYIYIFKILSTPI